MEFETLVQTRRSVRGFKKQPVPRAVIEEIIEIANGAPSSMNTQPRPVLVLTRCVTSAASASCSP